MAELLNISPVAALSDRQAAVLNLKWLTQEVPDLFVKIRVVILVCTICECWI